MTEKTLTTENIKPALDALRGELAPWPVVAKKQDRLNTAQLNAANSGITSSLVAQIIANTAAIRALESAITGTGLRALVVASLPAVGTTGILYIVPVTTYDPDTDADVVNYSNEYIWIPVEGGQASEGHYEQVGQTGIVINNGQLTITVNGTSVGTFTANQSGDTTAAITVPTNADYVDRTTDQTVAGKKTWTGEQTFSLPIVGSITGTASKAIADEDGTSIKTGYVNVAGNQTVTGDKSFTGSNTFNSILPNATNTYSLGSSSYQWDNLYASKIRQVDSFSGYADVYQVLDSSNNRIVSFRITKGTNKNILGINVHDQNNSAPKGLVIENDLSNNITITGGGTNNYLGTSANQWSSVYAQTYYYNGTQWGLDKANVWSAENTYTNTLLTLKQTGLETGVIPASNQTRRYRFTDKNNADLGWIQHRVNTSGDSYLEIYSVNKFNNGQLSPQGSDVANALIIGIHSDGKRYAQIMSDFYPAYTNLNCNLGSSDNKWKSLNGINPGALSLPDASSPAKLDITNWDMRATNGVIGLITASMDGWINVQIQRDVDFAVWVIGTYRQLFRAGLQGNGKYLVMLMFPITKNATVSLYTLQLDTSESDLSVGVYRFYPCLGNV